MRVIDDALHSWIAENLVNGCQPATLINTLININVDKDEAQKAVTQAQNHPYLKVSRDLKTKLQKRDALLNTLDHYQRMHPEYLKLARKKLPTFEKFMADYYSQNKPGLFKGAIDHWPAREWTPRKLVEKVGADTMVQVQQNRESNKTYEIDSVSHRKMIRFGDFIDAVESKETNDFYLTANNQALKDSPLKVLMSDIGTLGDGYLDPKSAEGRTFLWVGPKGIVTPLHHDKSNNIFIQIYGEKRFRLIPSLQLPYMYNHLAVFTPIDLLDPQPENYPLFNRVGMIDITVKPGDFLFIPIGWWHHVMGETASISLSFTNVPVTNQFFDYPING